MHISKVQCIAQYLHRNMALFFTQSLNGKRHALLLSTPKGDRRYSVMWKKKIPLQMWKLHDFLIISGAVSKKIVLAIFRRPGWEARSHNKLRHRGLRDGGREFSRRVRGSSGSSGGAREARAPPYFLDQNEVRRAEIFFLRPGTPLSQSLDNHPPPPPPYRYWEGRFLIVAICIFVFHWVITISNSFTLTRSLLVILCHLSRRSRS